jgi:hypothetical protein
MMRFKIYLHAGYGHFVGNFHYYATQRIQIGKAKREADQSLCRAVSYRIENSGPNPDQRFVCKRCKAMADRVPAAVMTTT